MTPLPFSSIKHLVLQAIQRRLSKDRELSKLGIGYTYIGHILLLFLESMSAR